jgi:D-alanyl-D-alanine carboxypeptidase (penicillin-binding protein 5/6)
MNDPMTRPTHFRRRATVLLALAVLVVAAGVEGLRLLASGGPVSSASHGVPLGGQVQDGRGDEAPRRDGYGELPAPRSERFAVRFRRAPRAGMVFDVRTGRVLWSRRPLARRPIASLTKMMTALLADEALPRGATVPVTREALDYQGSGVGMFRRGQRIDAVTMLYGLLLPSGNDAAIALALRVAGTQRSFVAWMNRAARRLGLTCTHFSSPSGIVDRGNYSCARDLARLTRLVLRRPRLRRIVGTRYAVRRLPVRRRRRLYLSNNNTLMTRGYGGVTGVKTGYTEAAGSCLVATARRGRRHLGVVLLGSPDTGAQGERLLDAAFRRVLR